MPPKCTQVLCQPREHGEPTSSQTPEERDSPSCSSQQLPIASQLGPGASWAPPSTCWYFNQLDTQKVLGRKSQMLPAPGCKGHFTPRGQPFTAPTPPVLGIICSFCLLSHDGPWALEDGLYRCAVCGWAHTIAYSRHFEQQYVSALTTTHLQYPLAKIGSGTYLWL